MRARAWIALGLLIAPAGPAASKDADPPPKRVVSLNLCADELVLRLAAPGTVRSVTWLSRDPKISNVVREAHSVPINHGLVEEIVALDPDLVIAGVYTTRITVALLKRLKVPVLELDSPTTLAESMEQIRTVADVLGQSERGTALVSSMQARLAKIEREAANAGPGERAVLPVAAVLQPNGFTVGRGSLTHDVLTRAGLRNLAAEQRIASVGWIPLESLLVAQPDLLIFNDAEDQSPALAYDVLRHPALSHRYRGARLVHVPSAWLNCPGPTLVDAVEKLAQAARSVPVVATAR